MPSPRAPRLWMELSIDRIESAIRVSARGSSFEQTKPRTLDEAHDALAWIRFATAVQRAAPNSKPLAPALLVQAQDVALAMNEAQRAILAAFAGSAEASSPVLYLRGLVDATRERGRR